MSHVLIPSVYVLMIRDNKVLLLRRRNTGYMDGWYTIPSGYLKDGEKLLDAAAREVREETGVMIQPNDLKLSHFMRRYAPGEDKIDFFFETRVWDLFIRIGEPETCDEVIWTDIGRIPEKTLLNVMDFIKYCYPKARFYSELGWGKERVPKMVSAIPTWF